MAKGFLVLLFLLLAAQIVRSSVDLETRKSHKRWREDYNGGRSKRNSQIRAGGLQVKHVHATKTLSKKNDNFGNLESLLFDREGLKKYVLHYLQTHGFAKHPLIAEIHEQRKSASRHLHGLRDSPLSELSNDNEKYKYNGDFPGHENQGGGLVNKDHSSSKENALDYKTKQDSRQSEHRKKVDTEIIRDKAKHKQRQNSGHESQRTESHATNKRSSVSGEKSRHHRQYSPYQFEQDLLAKKYSLPIYYSVREEDGKESADRYLYLSSNGQGVETKGKQRDYNEKRKHSAKGRQVSSKTNRGGINLDKTSHRESKRKSKNAVKVPPMYAWPQPFHQEESKYEKQARDEKQFTARYKSRAHQSSGHDHKSVRRGDLMKAESTPDVVNHNLKYKDHRSRNRSSVGHRSGKRDFIAVRPPQSLELEGFDVQPVHSKLRNQRKRKAPRGKEQLSLKSSESLRRSHEQERKGRRKSTVTSESHKHNDHFKAGGARKKSRQRETERKSSYIERSAKHAHRKNTKSSLRKDSRKDQQGARKKNIVAFKSEKKSRDSKKERVKKKSRRHGRRKTAVSRKSSHAGQTSHVREKSYTALQDNRSQKIARRKSLVRKKSSKYRTHEKNNHGRGTKRSALHTEAKTTAHKRKKNTRHKDSHKAKFSATWESLDKRKIPSWYDEAKFGIFVHWGVYSVPSLGSEWFWYHWKGQHLQKYVNFTRENFPPGFSYSEFAPMFRAEFFDAKQWAQLVARSGARYFVFTSKHHDGFTNWNSSVAWNWNSVDTGPHRNIVDELAQAFRNLKDPEVRFCLYYSMFEWFNPLYLKDKANGFKTDEYVKAVVKPQLYDLVNTYKPDYLWTDGEWEAKETYWRSKDFLAWLFNESPVKATVVVNDRWGKYCRGRHGGVSTGNDRYNPGKLEKRKWENAMTIDRQSWGFRREANLNDYLSIQELIKQLVTTVSCGGNLLMNIGPASDGTISPIFQERLTQMGDWLQVNGDAIYKTRPWRAQNDSVSGDVWYTAKDKHVFAIALNWPWSGKLVLGEPKATSRTRVTMMGRKRHVNWARASKHRKAGMVIHLPVIPVSDLPCMWAWTFKLSHVK